MILLRESRLALAMRRRLLWRQVGWPMGVAFLTTAGWAAFANDIAYRLWPTAGPLPPWWAPLPGFAFLFVLFMTSGGWFPFLAARWRLTDTGIAIRGDLWVTVPSHDVTEWRLMPASEGPPGLSLSIARRRSWFRRDIQRWTILLDEALDPEALRTLLRAHAPAREFREPLPAAAIEALSTTAPTLPAS